MVVFADPEASAEYTEVKKRVGEATAKVEQLMHRFAQTGRIPNREQFAYEGDYPDGGGGRVALWAFKGWKIRLYGWYCPHRRGDFVIGHVVFKDQRELSPADARLTIEAKKRYEKRMYDR